MKSLLQMAVENVISSDELDDDDRIHVRAIFESLVARGLEDETSRKLEEIANDIAFLERGHQLMKEGRVEELRAAIRQCLDRPTRH